MGLSAHTCNTELPDVPAYTPHTSHKPLEIKPVPQGVYWLARGTCMSALSIEKKELIDQSRNNRALSASSPLLPPPSYTQHLGEHVLGDPGLLQIAHAAPCLVVIV
jgi:hypothetical protein